MLEHFVGRGALALVITGAPGVGKTALWEAGLTLARQRGIVVLMARPSEAEAQHPFAALFDLLERVDAEFLERLPAPQRQALEAAILRRGPASAVPEPFAIGAGLLGVLRMIAVTGPVLLAVDDLQWLDPASADALAFAARRCQPPACRFLFARRSGRPTAVELAAGRDSVRRLELGPLSLESTYRLLAQRHGLSLPPRTLSQVFDATRGMPLLVLELGRVLAARDAPVLGQELPFADLAGTPFNARIAGLAPEARRALLAVALSGQTSRAALDAIADPLAIDDLLAAGLLLAEGTRLRASHPLLAAAVRRMSSTRQVREMHLDLAGSASEEIVRARHLALATRGSDADVAGIVAKAAAGAFRRGAVYDAVDLAQHAMRLTPPAAAEYPERLLELAEFLVKVGEPERASKLLAPRLTELSHGAVRARAHIVLAEAGDVADHEYHVDRALAESPDEPQLRIVALAEKSIMLSMVRVARIGEAHASSMQARELAAVRGDPGEPHALQAIAWTSVMRGLPLDGLIDLPAAREVLELGERSIERQVGVRHVFRGELGEARAVFRRLHAAADERGERRYRAVIQLQLCEVELRAGRVTECKRLLDQQHEWVALDDDQANWARCQALCAAIAGHPEQAERWAAAVTELAARSHGAADTRWDELEAQRAQGIAALLAQRPDRASQVLGQVWDYTRRQGVDDPGAFPVAPDLVEALTRTGAIAEATAVAGRLRDLAASQRHPWGLATADRCSATIALRSGYDEPAAVMVASAAALGELGLGFDRARALLWLGQMARRARKRAFARSFLEAAATAFDELGADGWAALARAERSGMGAGQPARPGELTAAEQRVADLAAEGLSNKQIAGHLFIAVHTVEVHLARAYAKLGIQSRAQLARHLTKRTRPRGAD